MIVLGALLLLAAQAPEPPVPSETQQVAALAFAPPLDRPLTYRVATRRLSRDGSFTSFALVYDLRWQRVGLPPDGEPSRFYRLYVRREGHATFKHALHGVLFHAVGEGEAAPARG